jgi:hypothetical protein
MVLEYAHQHVPEQFITQSFLGLHIPATFSSHMGIFVFFSLVTGVIFRWAMGLARDSWLVTGDFSQNIPMKSSTGPSFFRLRIGVAPIATRLMNAAVTDLPRSPFLVSVVVTFQVQAILSLTWKLYIYNYI